MTISFRPLRRDDFIVLSEWFSRPHVELWWREPYDLHSIEERYGSSIDNADATEVFIIEQDGESIGLIQRYLIDDNPDWKQALAPASVPSGAAGIDYVIGVESLVGHGIGTLAINTFIEDTWRRYPDANAIVAACQQENRRSWRALEKNNFHRVWAGIIESDDPSDEGPNYVYVFNRP